MATLQQIYVNLIAGGLVGSLSLGLFGLAIRFGYNNQLAPRSWNRPKEILKNVIQAPFAFSWMRWAMRLHYPDLMAGIPGTGTRQNGWAGPTLKVNLDGIVMLKYNVLLLKVGLVATILCMLIILPVNVTATCNIDLLGINTCEPMANLTDFENTTIAHIPPLRYNGTGTTAELSNFWYAQISPRYFAITAVALFLYWYICHLVWKEWIENLALRRIYYFEHDHYAERLEELNEIAELDVPEDPSQKNRPPWVPHPELRETVPNISLYSCLYQLPTQITTVNLPDSATDLERQLTATVDFFDLCVPNQPGFSSSVVAATVLPEPANVAQAWTKWYYCGKQLRKLRYIRHFIQLHLESEQARDEGQEVVEFDPDAPKAAANKSIDSIPENEGVEVVAAAEQASAQEFVGDTQTAEEPVSETNIHVESERQTEDRPSKDEEQPLLEESEPSTADAPGKESRRPLGSFFDAVVGQAFGRSSAREKPCEEEKLEEGAIEKQEVSKEEVTDTSTKSLVAVSSRQDSTNDTAGKPQERRSINDEIAASSSSRGFQYSRFNAVEAAKRIGLDEAAMTKDLVNGIGIEQLSVFAREYAQSSSNAYPFGFAGEKIRFSTLERLIELEQEYLEKLEEANVELIEARESVNRLSSGIPAGNIDEDAYDPTTSKKRDAPNETAMEEAAIGHSTTSSGMRQRAVSASVRKWHQAQAVVGNMHKENNVKFGNSSICGGCMKRCSTGNREILQRAADITATMADEDLAMKNLKKVVNVLDHPTYAVITFSSRQAAIAARQCLADGGGLDRWIELEELPVAPLADAPPWNIMFCRGCCRPVTLTISEREKKFRRFVGITVFLLFCFFYTIPLALTSQMLNPEKLAQVFPGWQALQDPNNLFFKVLSGISSGFLYTIFFSFCPQLFKAIANFEGNVASKRSAEDRALAYFWFFMMSTAFTGTALTQMAAEVFLDSAALGTEIKQVLVGVANSIPTQQAPVWMNWLVVKFTYTLPFLYMFQANTFGFSIIRWQWCGRLMRGGGPGGPPPYRIYVDLGTALICIVAIAPTCPLIAPLALAYYAINILMLRWLLIFVYRPWYDAGGNKWPALHNIILSSTVFGQVLLGTILLLRNAYIPGILILLAIFPTFTFSSTCKHNFLRAYNDAGLLQTSRADGWDTATSRSREEQEEFRKWLVDSHRASYVPICLAGSESPLTVEPAVVVATQKESGKSMRGRGSKKLTKQRGARFARVEASLPKH